MARALATQKACSRILGNIAPFRLLGAENIQCETIKQSVSFRELVTRARNHALFCYSGNRGRSRRSAAVRSQSPDSAASHLEDVESEAAKFVDMEAEMAEAFGPPVLLLLGLAAEERDRVQAALMRSGADFIVVAPVTQAMLTEQSLWDAMNSAAAGAHVGSPEAAPQQFLTAGSLDPAAGSPASQAAPVALCLLSGLSSEECLLLVDLVEQELPHLARERRLAFAAMLPAFANKPLLELVEDILRDHADAVNESAGH